MSERLTRRAYQCTRCPKIMRKGRMEAHVLKQHVPLDQVPFWCSLCLFRCQDRQTLINHITKYKRHLEAVNKLDSNPNYAEIFRRASDPYVMTNLDMTQLGKEETMDWVRRNPIQGFTEAEDVFQDDDEDHVIVSGGLKFPSWIMCEEPPKKKESIPQYIPTPIGMVAAVNQPTQPQNEAPTSLLNLTQPETWGAFQYVAQPMPSLDTPPTAPSRTPTYTPFKPSNKHISTPCQDEGSCPFGSEEEPLPKRQKTASAANSEDHEGAATIAKALTEGFRGVVDALNATTRAIRCQEKTSEKILVTLERLERRLTPSSIESVKENQRPNQQFKRRT